MPSGATLVISCTTLPPQSNPQPPPHIAVDYVEAVPSIPEDLNMQLVSPAIPATIDRALSTDKSVAHFASATLAVLKPLGGILSSPALENLTKAIDELAKVCADLYNNH
jgi:hypothetical protein